MSRTTFQLVLLVSCAHAMVHVYEQSLPSVEQMIGEDFGVGPVEADGAILDWGNLYRSSGGRRMIGRGCVHRNA